MYILICRGTNVLWCVHVMCTCGVMCICVVTCVQIQLAVATRMINTIIILMTMRSRELQAAISRLVSGLGLEVGYAPIVGGDTVL